MRKINLTKILSKHALWLRDMPGGERANLSGLDLRKESLRFVDLRWAILEQADLRGVDLTCAVFSGAILKNSNLKKAKLNWAVFHQADLENVNLEQAVLEEADLRAANLAGTNFRQTNLARADLRESCLWLAQHVDEAKNLVLPFVCPETGAYTAFQKAGDQVVQLEIPADAERCSSTGRECRASKATVVSITTPDGRPVDGPVSWRGLVYRVGDTLEVKDFGANRWQHYAPGIRHYMTRREVLLNPETGRIQ